MNAQVRKTKELSVFAVLAAFSVLSQVIHLGYQTRWGMWIDIVGVFWIVAYLLYSFRGGLIVSIVGFIIITLTAPSSWIGGGMKFIATLTVTASLFVYAKYILNKSSEVYKNYYNLIIPVLVAIFIRGFVMCFVNYYYALPIWIPGVSVGELMAMYPWYIIAGVNMVQTVIEVVFAWLLVFKFDLIRYK